MPPQKVAIVFRTVVTWLLENTPEKLRKCLPALDVMGFITVLQPVLSLLWLRATSSHQPKVVCSVLQGHCKLINESKSPDL